MSHTWSSLTARYGQPVLCAQPTGEFPEELYAFGTVPREFAVFHVPEDRREMLPAGVIVFARRDTDSWMPDPASKLFAIKHLLALNEGLQAQLDAANRKLAEASIIKDVLRDEHGAWLATSYIDGFTWSIRSQYGSGAYHWSHPGTKTLKEFLKADADYLLGKLWQGRPLTEPDWYATRRAIWDRLREDRMARNIEAGETREMFDALVAADSVEEYAHTDPQVSWHWYEYIVEGQRNDAKQFRDCVIVPFCRMFRKQLREAREGGAK